MKREVKDNRNAISALIVLAFCLGSIFYASQVSFTGAPIAKSRGIGARTASCGDGQCFAGETCSQDRCCNGVVKNLQTDPLNCGSCNNACQAGLSCISGSCQNPSLSCSQVAGACPAGSTQILTYDANPEGHVWVGAGSSRSLCCGTASSPVTTACNNVILRASGVTDAHVQSSSLSSFATPVCMSSPTFSVACSFKASCAADESCLGSLSDVQESHFAPCGHFASNLCCKFTA